MEEKKSLWAFGTPEVVYSGIGAALYGVLSWATNLLQIPGAANVSSLSELWVSGADLNTAIVFNFVPAGLTNLIWGLILTPVLMVAYGAVKSRSGR